MTGMEMEAEILLSNYKKVDGMLIPHSITIFYNGEEAKLNKYTHREMARKFSGILDHLVAR